MPKPLQLFIGLFAFGVGIAIFNGSPLPGLASLFSGALTLTVVLDTYFTEIAVKKNTKNTGE